MDERTDEEIIADYIGGEEDAFAELTQRHLKSVYSFVYRLIGNEQEAEDVTQDAFVKIWKSLKNYNSNTSRFKTWSLHIARNTAIDFLRKRKHIALSQFEDEEGNNVVLDTLMDEDKLPEQLFAEGEDASELARAVAELSHKHREVLVLHYTNNISFEEMSEILGEPPNTLKSRHRRAILTLRKIMPNNAPRD